MEIMLSDILNKPVYFITGIDTDCGKTAATGYLSKKLIEEGINCITQKLIQTGCKEVSEDIAMHREIEGRPFLPVDVDKTTCPLIYSYPCSPHMAIALDKKAPEYEKTVKATLDLLKLYDKVLIEGAGGLMVPLDGLFLTRDYILTHHIPVILVTTAKLGSINHTLLNIEVLQNSGVDIEAVVYNTAICTDKLITEETRTYLKQYLAKKNPQIHWIELPDIRPLRNNAQYV